MAENVSRKDLYGGGDVGMRSCPIRNPGTSCPSRNPAFSFPVYPALDPMNLPTQAQHGVLGQLDGVWENKPGTYGIHTTMMPAPGTTSEQMFGAFHFHTQEYTEELKFTKKDGPVRNRFGSNEQFVGSVNYEQTIADRNGIEIHNEVGQYLWLGVWTHSKDNPYSNGEPCLYSRQATEADVKQDFTFPTLAAGAQGPQFVPPFSICRQGCIPHGNSIQLFGNQPKNKDGVPQKEFKYPPKIYPGEDKGVIWDADSVAFHPSMGYTAEKLNKDTNPEQPDKGKRAKPPWAHLITPENYPPKDEDVKELVKNLGFGPPYMGRIFHGAPLVIGAQKLKQPDGKVTESPLFPYCVQPNFKLVDANQKLLEDGFEIVSHDMFTLNTQTNGSLGGLQGGSLNSHGTERYCKVQDMRFTMWISKVKNKATGEIHDQLQYEQVIYFEFHFDVHGNKSPWPHIQCNTLIRKPAPEASGKRSRSS